jgi:hypothetical protein
MTSTLDGRGIAAVVPSYLVCPNGVDLRGGLHVGVPESAADDLQVLAVVQTIGDGASVCLASCTRIRGTSARSTRRLNRRVMVSGWMRRPSGCAGADGERPFGTVEYPVAKLHQAHRAAPAVRYAGPLRRANGATMRRTSSVAPQSSSPWAMTLSSSRR